MGPRYEAWPTISSPDPLTPAPVELINVPTAESCLAVRIDTAELRAPP
ncbi:MAG: hypothetical protein ACI8PT_001390, partial [Gammaproteobacteria bacterium]